MLRRTRCINLPPVNKHTNLLTQCTAHNPNIWVCPMGHLLVDSCWEQMVLATVAPEVLRGGGRLLDPPQHDWRWRKMMCWMIGLFCFDYEKPGQLQNWRHWKREKIKELKMQSNHITDSTECYTNEKPKWEARISKTPRTPVSALSSKARLLSINQTLLWVLAMFFLLMKKVVELLPGSVKR